MAHPLKKLFEQASNSNFNSKETKALLDELRPQLIHAHEDNELGKIIRSILSDLLANNPEAHFLQNSPLHPHNPFKINPKELVFPLLENTVFTHNDIGLDSWKNYDDFIKQNANFDIKEILKNLSIKSAKFIGRSWVYFDEHGDEILVIKRPTSSDEENSINKEIQMNLNIRKAVKNGYFKSVEVDDIPKPAGLAKLHFKDLPLTDGVELPDNIDEEGMDYIYFPPKKYFEYLNDITDINKFIEAAVKAFGFILECYQYGYILNESIGLFHSNVENRSDGTTFLVLVFYFRTGFVPGNLKNFIANSLYPNVGKTGPRDIGHGIHANELTSLKNDLSLHYMPFLRMNALENSLKQNNVLSPEEYVTHVANIENLSKIPLIIQILVSSMIELHYPNANSEDWTKAASAIITILNKLFNTYANIKNDVFSDLIDSEIYAAQLELWVGKPFLKENVEHGYVCSLFKKAHPEIVNSIFKDEIKKDHFRQSDIGANLNAIYPILETTKLGFLFPILLINNQIDNKYILNCRIKTKMEQLTEHDLISNHLYSSWLKTISPLQMHKFYFNAENEDLFNAWITIKIKEDHSLIPIENERLSEWEDDRFHIMLYNYETWDCIVLCWITKNVIEIEKNQPNFLQPWQVSLRKYVMRFNLILNYAKYDRIETFLKNNIEKFNFKKEFLEIVNSEDFPEYAAQIFLEKSRELIENFKAECDPEITHALERKLQTSHINKAPKNSNIAPKPIESRRDNAFSAFMKKRNTQFLSYISAKEATVNGAKLLLENLSDINTYNENEESALYFACKQGHIEIVKFLLKQNNIDINKSNIYQTSPLHAACKNGNAEIVRILLNDERISDINQLDTLDSTPLIYASLEGHAETVNILLQDPRININRADSQNITALYLACERNHLHVVKALLNDSRTDINISSASGISPLKISCQFNYFNIVEAILNHSNIKIENMSNLIKFSYEKKASESVIALYKYQKIKHPVHIKSLIDEAFLYDNNVVMEYLLNDNQYLIEKEQIYNLFIRACEAAKPAVLKSILHDSRLNLIDINKPDNNGCTPLFIACEHGRTETVKILLSDGRIQVNKLNNARISPLFIAFSAEKYDIVNILLGSNYTNLINSNHEGKTPLHMACFIGNDVAVTKILQNPSIDINKPDNAGRTPLYYACEQGNSDTVKILLANSRIHPNKPDNNGCTPRQIAAQRYHNSIANLIPDNFAPNIENKPFFAFNS